jgi:2,3-bisphosphoglycerate-independent phosphoglycerate mutase
VKYCVLIMDGAAGLPLSSQGGMTSMELARTPNLDKLAQAGLVGLAHMVPEGLEPDSSVACMSIFGYDPKIYYKGRAPIEAISMNIPVAQGDVLFRCNLVTIQDGLMVSHSAGSIRTDEAHELVGELNKALGGARIHIYPGVSYRSIMKLKGAEETTKAICTPPHDIPGKPVQDYLPRGEGGKLLIDLMERSEKVLKDSPVNERRIERGELPATSIWLFWGSGGVPTMPRFQDVYHRKAAVTSGVSLLQGLGKMSGMDILDIKGVTDGLDNDYYMQAKGALDSLKHYDVVIIHIEAPDEAGHAGSMKEKVLAIEKIDEIVVKQIYDWRGEDLRLLVTADHPTPVSVRTHTSDPVPFVLWGVGLAENGAKRLTEVEAARTGLFINPGWKIMPRLIGE